MTEKDHSGSPETSTSEFRISIPDADVADLRHRLKATLWPPDVADEGWEAGMPVSAQRELAVAWAEFDWAAVEKSLNRQEHIMVDVGGQRIHAVRHRGKGPHPLPLVLTHGWPSSFYEWHRVVGPLSDPVAYGGDAADAFDVVTPSLPGYIFSPPPVTPGTSPRKIASLWVGLMNALGYERFAAHGCDWGSYVTALLGLHHPESVVGIHMGMVSIGTKRDPGEESEEDRSYAERFRAWRAREHGYVSIQSTKPQTLGTALTDSPAGLAAWVGEKWLAWSDRDSSGNPLVTRDDLLTTLSLYWFTRSIGSASRLYYESARDSRILSEGERIEVPSGFLLETSSHQRPKPRARGVASADRPGAPPRSRAERAFNVTRWTEAPVGGHFPALETPELFVNELREFFRPLRRNAIEDT